MVETHAYPSNIKANVLDLPSKDLPSSFNFELLPAIEKAPAFTSKLYIAQTTWDQPLLNQDNITVVVNTDIVITAHVIDPSIRSNIYDTSNVLLVWTRDGIVVQQGKGQLNSSLRFKMTANTGGIFMCTVSNDYGSSQSSQIQLQPLNDALLNVNLVQNPCGAMGLDQWTCDEHIVVKNYSHVDDTFINTSLTTNNPNFTFPYTAISTRESEIARLFNSGSLNYFTVDKLMFYEFGGHHVMTMYQDIDVSTISELFSSNVCGYKSVSLECSAYIGVATSYYDIYNVHGIIEDITSMSVQCIDIDGNVLKTQLLHPLNGSKPLLPIDSSTFDTQYTILNLSKTMSNIPINTNTVRVIVFFDHTGTQQNSYDVRELGWENDEIFRNSSMLMKTVINKDPQLINRIDRYGIPRFYVSDLNITFIPRNADRI